MPLRWRVMLAVGASVLAWGGSFVLILGSALVFGRCPSGAQCGDLPFIGGFGLAVIAAPLVALIAGVMTFRRSGRTPVVTPVAGPPRDR